MKDEDGRGQASKANRTRKRESAIQKKCAEQTKRYGLCIPIEIVCTVVCKAEQKTPITQVFVQFAVDATMISILFDLLVFFAFILSTALHSLL